MSPLFVVAILIFLQHTVVASTVEAQKTEHLIDFDVRTSFNANGRRIISINEYDSTYGPTIRVQGGDTIHLKLQNHICSSDEIQLSSQDAIWRDYCDTALHFHGLVPIGNENDGVPGLVQDAIKSEEVYWYNFTIPETVCGTFWYHSHSTVQYGDGLRGVLIVECPEYDALAGRILKANVDDVEAPAPLSIGESEASGTKNVIEEQIIALSDWYNEFDLNVLRDEVMSYDGTTDPRIDGSLINGSEKQDIEFTLKENTEGIILRIVNSGMSGTQIFHLANHKMVIMETDGTLVKPYVVETLSLAVGQRVTVVVHLNEEVKSGASALKIVNGCNKMMGYITKTAWFVKENGANERNKDGPASIKSLPGLNKQELYHELEPVESEESSGLWEDDNIQLVEMEYWYDSDGATKNNYDTGMYKVNGKTFSDYYTAPITLNTGQVAELIINSKDHMRHPWHLHGQRFQVVSLGTGHEGSFSPSIPSSKAARKYQEDLHYWRDTGHTPMTRDSINIPGNSYAVLRIKSDFEGKWVLHCHVDWHIAKGLGVVLEMSPRNATNTAQSADQKQDVPLQQSSRVKVFLIYLAVMIAINFGLYRLLM